MNYWNFYFFILNWISLTKMKRLCIGIDRRRSFVELLWCPLAPQKARWRTSFSGTWEPLLNQSAGPSPRGSSYAIYWSESFVAGSGVPLPPVAFSRPVLPCGCRCRPGCGHSRSISGISAFSVDSRITRGTYNRGLRGIIRDSGSRPDTMSRTRRLYDTRWCIRSVAFETPRWPP